MTNPAQLPSADPGSEPQVTVRDPTENTDNKITLPPDMGFRDAAEYCEQKATEQEQEGTFSASLPCLPWQGAAALGAVLQGYSATKKAGQSTDVPTSNGSVSIHWGSWNVAGLGTVRQEWRHGSPQSGLAMHYHLAVTCRNELEPQAQQLLDRVREATKRDPLWKGGAVRLEVDCDGDLLIGSAPTILDIPTMSPDAVLLNQDIAAAVRSELFFPLANPGVVRQHGCTTRRGVLLAGRPGTGKTLSARVAASLALQQGMSVFYLADARGIETALRIAESQAPALLVCEDVDRQLRIGGDEDDDNAVASFQNALDGLDRSKDVFFLATTNRLQELPSPLLRPGRFDSVITLDLPNAETAAMLLERALGDVAPDGLAQVGESISGLLPAGIAEVGQRSKLRALTSRDTPLPTLDEIRAAADAVRAQQAALEAAEAAEKVPQREEMAVYLHDGGANGLPNTPFTRIAAAATRA